MAYKLKYITSYDGGPQGAELYTTEFHFKNYTGEFSNFLSSGQPTIQRWDKDDPKPGIKGSSLEIGAINTGSLPLSSFFSVEDDNCMVIHKWKGQVLFIGFLVQDDCSEITVDYAHIVSLTATDNLGLLKDVPFDQANKIVGDGNRIIIGTQAYSVPPVDPAAGYLYINSTTTGALIGDTIIVSGTPGSDGVYTIANVVPLGAPGTAIYVDGFFPFAIPDSTGYTFTFITSVDLRDRLPLAYIIRICLYSTSLLLNTDVYASIIETITATNRFLEETFMRGIDFNNGNNEFKSCYDVLNIILERFNACFFQAEGLWNIKRSDEHRYYDNAITGFRYDANMVYVSDITFDDIFICEPNVDSSLPVPQTYPLSAPLESILRPYKFDKETFNYKQPADLLCNYNLQKLGDLIRKYNVAIGPDTFTVKEYVLLCWFDGLLAPFSDRFIRITYDSGGFETQRYAVITGPHGDSSRTAQSEGIEANANDSIIYSFSFRTDVSQPGNVNITFSVRITDGFSDLYLQADGSWDTPASFVYNVPAGDNTNNWHNVEKTSKGIPFNAILYIYMGGQTLTNTDETWYKDFSLQYLPKITDSTIITGHQHSNTQQPTIKNNEDIDIFIDDSPSNNINGTLFLSGNTGPLRTLTLLWTYPFSLNPGARLGYWTTFEQLFWRRIQRTKIEGTMIGNIQNVLRSYHADMIWQNVDLPPFASGVILLPEIVALLSAGSVFTITDTISNNGTYTVLQIGPTFGDPNFVVTGVSATPEVVTGTIQLLVPRHISMLTLIRYTNNPGKNFIFGTLSINFKSNNFTGTFWEQWYDGEMDDLLIGNYNFKYLYQTNQ